MLEIMPIPAFDDNYIWMLRNSGNRRVVVVDPGDARPVMQILKARQLELSGVLITHKHGDHVGGLEVLCQRFPGVPVYGPTHEPVPLLTHRLQEGDELALEEPAVRFRILELPGHTEGHLGYYASEPGVLFCGDTLFAAGCGRVFSGTHEQLHQSLQRIAALPGETLLYCAHEYTLDNLGFAQWVEPQSEPLAARLEADRASRKAGRPTVPSRLDRELATNPFLRTEAPQVVAAAEGYAGKRLESPAEVFRALRTWKDREYD